MPEAEDVVAQRWAAEAIEGPFIGIIMYPGGHLSAHGPFDDLPTAIEDTQDIADLAAAALPLEPRPTVTVTHLIAPP